MAKKREAYDPLQVVTEAAAGREARERSVQKARDRAFEWQENSAIPELTVPVILGFGKFLQTGEGQFWVDYLGCELACCKRVCDLGLFQADQTALAADVLAFTILRKAVADDANAVQMLLESVRVAGQTELIAQALRGLRDRLEPWWSGRETPPTPWITAAELSRACRGRIEGFSEGNVSKGMQGQLKTEARVGKPKTAVYRRFRHASCQRAILEFLVPVLKESKVCSFIFSS